MSPAKLFGDKAEASQARTRSDWLRAGLQRDAAHAFAPSLLKQALSAGYLH